MNISFKRAKSSLQVALIWCGLACACRADIDEGFEGSLPDFHTFRAAYASDASRAHSGEKSLRVTPSQESGGAYFRLDGKLDFTRSYMFSLWVCTGSNGTATAYISASNGKERYTVSRATGVGVPGKWVRLSGAVRAKQWRPADRDFMLALSTRGESWFDDVVLREDDVPDPAIEVWPQLETVLHATADQHAVTLRRGAHLVLKAQQAALAPDIARPVVERVSGATVVIPAEGLLAFTIDADEALTVTGRLWLAPDSDLRPGLRAYVLSDDTVVAAPMVKAAPWRNLGNHGTGPAPAVQGEQPATEISLAAWRLPRGRHHLIVAGPHTRPGGVFERIEIQASAQPAKDPLYTFALMADTHLGSGRHEWMNIKMDEPAIHELAQTLKQVKAEGAACAFIAGDMTDGGTRDQYEHLANVVKSAALPVYGCVGNHDSFRSTSRADLMALVPDLFPGASTDYVLEKPPLRFVVLDGSWWRDREGRIFDHYDREKTVGVTFKPEQLAWLRKTLAEDTTTPTVIMWHYVFSNIGGVTSCGYQLGSPTLAGEIMAILAAAPNVVATLNGHMHYNAVNDHQGIVCIQNAAYVEWPNMYRVFRVFADRMEWEVRQVGNRGFVSEGMVPDKGLTWMLSTRDGDLGGTVRLVSRGPQ